MNPTVPRPAALNRPSRWRQLIQWLFLLWILWLGWRFGQFVGHFTSQGATAFVPRPAGVDGFLPIGGLASLKLWLLRGEIDPSHPAALVLLLTFLAMSLLAKKSFCSWLCPVGTLSEGAWKLGRRLLGRNWRMWRWLDIPLRGLKYALLGFFVKILLLDMPSFAIASFLQSPYWAISDVKMLRFFTAPSSLTLTVVGVATLLSLVYQNFWCRYLCPYGALLGLISLLSPFKIRRERHSCTSCQRCSAACPALLPVHRLDTVMSVECTGCLTCVDSCPHGSLRMGTLIERKPLPRWVFPLLVLVLYSGGVSLGMVSGHWHSSLEYSDYLRLIPLADRIGH
ncbi:MAG: 4Fe-4S binding protein [Desulfuromonas thiophila]|nr:4Fe-4S binding protein [Desulfuromonas thiophila]